jgi:hypothetical protein
VQSRTRARLNAITLATPLGVVLARGAGCAVAPRRGGDGLILASGWTAPLPRARAFTVGDVVIAREARLLADADLLDHEAQHAQQWAACGGVLGFPLLYGVAMLVSYLRTGNHYARNVFEVRADLRKGGYPVPGRAGLSTPASR